MANVLFIGAHQDDEILCMGGGILNHTASGTNNVYYACITDGSASGIRTSLVPVPSVAAFIKIRNAETAKSLGRMGGVIQLEASQGRMVDGTLNTDPNKNDTNNPGYNGNDINPGHVNMGIVSRIRNLLQQIATARGVATNSIAVKTHSYMDQHEDHRAISQAVLYLMYLGEITDVRQYLTPAQCQGTPYTQYTNPAIYKTETFLSAIQLGCSIEHNAAQEGKYVDACLEHTATNEKCPENSYSGYATYGVGHKSVKVPFDYVCPLRYSYYHIPPNLIGV